MDMNKLFHRGAVYQIYPRSFCDSNGDGIGDIPGIISKLDYLKDLGVKIIWLSPVYKSPLFDMGYDVADYYSIHPDYGTMEDFDRLLEEAKKRDLKIVMDLVVNHTSDEHEWFIQSKDPKSPYHNFYYWRKGKGEDGMTPPNNWTSQFSGPAWSYEPSNGLWYLHLFSKKQPDLDWHNPRVLEEVEKIINFYLDKGVYGFRCDVINQIYKESLEDGKGHAASGCGNEHYLMTEGNHRILAQIHQDCFESRGDRVMIGETYNVDIANGNRFLDDHELDMFFQFDLMGVDKILFGAFMKKPKTTKFKNVAFKWQKGVSWNANYLENHDQLRSIPRFGDEKQYWNESGKCLGLFNLSLRGTPFIYQGQEIGMVNYKNLREPSKSKDCVSWMVWEMVKKFPFPRRVKLGIISRLDRDHERAPMQWNDGVSAGFSSNPSPWLEVNESKSFANVEIEEKDANSILNFYKRMLALREKEEALTLGDFQEMNTRGNLIAFTRSYNGRTLTVIINLGKKKIRFPSFCKGKETLINTYPTASDEVYLRPYEALIVA